MPAPNATLSRAEVRALAVWKHRYALEDLGFTRTEANRLSFVKWLYSVARIGEGVVGA